MMRSMAYRRYFSTAMAMQTSITELATSIESLASGPSDPNASPAAYGTTVVATSTLAKTAAPLYSHLSCWRRSAPARRYRGTCRASQPSRLTMAAVDVTFPAMVQAGLTGYRLPLASMCTSRPAAAVSPGPTVVAIPSSSPAVTRVTDTRCQRPAGSRPSGKSQSVIAISTLTSGPARNSTATQPSGSVPWCSR